MRNSFGHLYLIRWRHYLFVRGCKTGPMGPYMSSRSQHRNCHIDRFALCVLIHNSNSMAGTYRKLRSVEAAFRMAEVCLLFQEVLGKGSGVHLDSQHTERTHHKDSATLLMIGAPRLLHHHDLVSLFLLDTRVLEVKICLKTNKICIPNL